MATQVKIDTVAEYAQKFKEAKSIFLADFKGINVEQDTRLRRNFRESNVEYRVLKNTLAKRSLHDAGIEDLDELLEGVTAFAFSESDPVAPIKVIEEFVKNEREEVLKIKGCIFEGQYFGTEQVGALASLPTREALLAQLLGVLQAPLSNFMNVLQATGRRLVGTLDAVKEQKSA